MLTKAEYRSRAKARLKDFLHQQSKQTLDQSVCHFVQSLTQNQNYVASFKALSLEPNLETLHAKNFVYPKVVGESLKFYLSEEFARGSWGVMEPQGTQEVNLPQISVVLVPGSVFDSSGGRLGQGAGFYDKTLKNYKGIKVGVGYSVQIEESIPLEDHDVEMNYIVTEKGVIKCQ